MNWLIQTLSSTIGRKLLMALSGLFLILFLPVHLIGNLQLLKEDGGEAFNIYAKFMTTTPIVKIASYLLYSTFLLHIIVSIFLTRQNNSARGSERYAVNASVKGVSWNSKNMGILGTILFVFLVIHLKNFWFEMHWGDIPMATYGEVTVKNLYFVVAQAYTNLFYVILYVASMMAVGFHLYHGFQSAFQTLGLSHKKYTPAIKFLGIVYAWAIPIGFALIPILMYLDK